MVEARYCSPCSVGIGMPSVTMTASERVPSEYELRIGPNLHYSLSMLPNDTSSANGTDVDIQVERQIKIITEQHPTYVELPHSLNSNIG